MFSLRQDVAVVNSDNPKVSKSTYNPIAYLESIFSEKKPRIKRSSINVRSTQLICDVAERFGYQLEDGWFTTETSLKAVLYGFKRTQAKTLERCKALPLVEPQAGTKIANTLELFKKNAIVKSSDLGVQQAAFEKQISVLRRYGWCILKLETGGYQLVPRDYEFE